MAKKLGPLDPYFTKLAEAMAVWIAAWQELNPESSNSMRQENGPVKENGASE